MQPKNQTLAAAIIAAASLIGGLASAQAQQTTPASSGTAAPKTNIPVVTSNPLNEEVVQLSPFQVNGGSDRGYQAFNTLSGTRLNSKLEDLGSSISVITKQQMEDLALLDINDVFRYEASTEGTDNFTTFNRNRSGGVNDQIQSDPARANRVRGVTAAGQSVGGANTAWGTFTSNSNVPFDPYNIAAVEISRGPNSNLFGLGQAAGTVSVVPSQANPNRRTYNADVRADSYGGHRESFNINTPILPGKVGLRVAGVNESKGFERKPSSERIQRGFATILIQPFKNTTFRASAERYNNDYRRPNSITARDTSAEWKAAGSPTWDPTTMMVTYANGSKAGPFAADSTSVTLPGLGISTTQWSLPTGLIGGYNGFYGHAYAYFDGTELKDFTIVKTNNAVTGTALPSNPFSGGNSTLRYLTSGTLIMRQRDVLGVGGLPLYIVPGTADKSIYDYSRYNVVAPNHGTDQSKTYSAELEQIVFNTPHHLLAAKLGAFQQKYSRNSYGFIDNLETVIYVDVNEKKLDGTPNPYFKRPYVQATAPSMTFQPQNNTIMAADLAYQLTPAAKSPWLSWIGVQRIGTHAEQNIQDRWQLNYAARATGLNYPWINPTASQNLVGTPNISERWYLGDANGQNVDYGAGATENMVGTFPLRWYDNRNNAWVSTPTTIEEVLNSGAGARERTEIRTLNATLQSFFFNNRLVATAGLRRDKYRQRTGAGGFVDPKTGLVSLANTGIFGPAQNFVSPSGVIINLPGWAEQSGDTKTYGAVVKLTNWLSAHVNKSDSFAPQVVRQAVDSTGNVPNPHGYSTEWGVSVTSPDGKFNVRVNRFQTKELYSRGSEVGTLGNRYLDMEGRPDGSNNIQVSSFRYFAQQIALGRLAAAGNAKPSQLEIDTAVAKLMGVTQEWYNRLVYSGPSQPQTVGTTDVSSKGFELEATYNPTRNWRMKFTGSQTRAQDDRVSPEIYNWWQQRLPVWTSLRSDIVPGDGKGRLWWDTAPGTYYAGGETRTPQTRWIQDQWGAYWAAATNAGRPRTQMREYRFAGISSYDFTEGTLKGVTVGGALRWESKASIGFLAGPAETSGPYQGAVLFLDNNKPVWDPARAYLDLSASYRFKLFNDKIRTRAALNVKNVTESGRLQPIAINPDGTPYAYRIVDPRQFIFSMSFEL
jgi:outer membrane receptor protein involved in Fe transport